jgi:hypothetical protein
MLDSLEDAVTSYFRDSCEVLERDLFGATQARRDMAATARRHVP